MTDDEPFPGSPDDMMQTIASLRSQIATLMQERDDARASYKLVDRDARKWAMRTVTATNIVAGEKYKDAYERVVAENAELRAQLEEAKAALRSISEGSESRVTVYERIAGDALAALEGKPAP